MRAAGDSLLAVSARDDNAVSATVDGPWNPWQERKDLGLVAGLLGALRLLATAPRRFLEGTRVEAGLWGPFLFAGLVSLLAMAANALVLAIVAATLSGEGRDLVLRMEVWNDAAEVGTNGEISFPEPLRFLLGFQVVLLLFPLLFLFILFGVLLNGALIHVLMILSRTRRTHGFRATVVAACYTAGAAPLGVIPVVGDILSLVAMAVLFSLGLRVLQGVSAVRAGVLGSIGPVLVLVQWVVERVI